ncbi:MULTISPECIES: hypothetical protein [unclassified Synechococcus]|uniref:hypothetical protein n=1 Tax=unclassified Synechococcus TaxID=2626047 RepID=UPI0021A4CE80|nr:MULTISPECIES: hypothetical protein [unclassified Synechococcus]MCT0214271.1 hypothetical protein [Synechococcus sp. CS-1326]MCT0234435.1 hypothetical protein [Synechococcus sp. CS-1327]
MASPVAWSMAWSESGELAFADRFDLLQTLIRTETPEVQYAFVASLERLSLEEVSCLCTDGLTGQTA